MEGKGGKERGSGHSIEQTGTADVTQRDQREGMVTERRVEATNVRGEKAETREGGERREWGYRRSEEEKGPPRGPITRE